MVLVRCGINRLIHIDRAAGELIRRWGHEKPGDLIHVDLFAVGYMALVRSVPRPGAFYSYIAASLGRHLEAWVRVASR